MTGGDWLVTDGLLRAREVAQLLKVSVRTVWRLVRRRELRRVKISSRVVRFSRREVDRLLARKERYAPAGPAA